MNPTPAPEEPTQVPTAREAQADKEAEVPQPKEKYILKLILTALGLFLWGIAVGVPYALFSYENPDVLLAIETAFGAGFVFALPVLVVMTVIGLLVRSRHAQKVVYWTTVVVFTAVGIIAAYFVYALSDPNLE